jgi:hypothetical protein
MSMARRSLLSGLLLAVLTFAHIQVATAQSFPRLGAYLIGVPQDYNQEESQIAKLGVVILGMYQGWTGGGQTPQQVITAIKKLNPNIKVFIYTNIGVLQYPILTGVGYEGLGPIDATPWWLYESGTSGSMVLSSFGDDYYEINTTTYSKVNSSGQNYPVWRAALDNSLFVTPTPSVDGIYVDNVYWKPRVNGDWTLSGSSQSDSNPTTQQIYRLGYVAYINHLKALMAAGKYVIGNVADWGDDGADISEYQGVLAGGLMESIVGESSSYEAWEGWAGMMAYYTKVMNATATPQLSVFSQDGSATDYQGMRYGLCSALMGNAYYYYDLGVGYQTYNTVTTFDEFNSNLGAALAAPLVFPGAAAWQKGVYRRDFENGIALVNPKGNGTQTVTLETSYKHLKGTQDPAVNNGATVTQVTLNDRDGVILLRLTPKAAVVPAAPSLSVH